MEKKREPIKDVAFLVDFLRDLAVSEYMAIFEDCADALEREHEKHLGECAQIAQYDDEIRGMKHESLSEQN